MKFSQLHKNTQAIIIIMFLAFSLILGFFTALVFNKVFPKDKIQISTNDNKTITKKQEKSKKEEKKSELSLSKEEEKNIDVKKDITKSNKSKDKNGLDDFISKTYKVGKDVEKGIYKIVSTNSSSSFYLISDTDDKEKLDFHSGIVFFNFAYVDLKEGEFLHLVDGELLKSDENKPYEPKDNIYTSGQYKVGYDIPIGKYMIKPKSQVGYIEISKTPSNKDKVFSQYIEKPIEIEIKEGEYLTISMTDIELGN